MLFLAGPATLAMLVALLERAPAELWSRSPALCPPLKVMLLYATSKRVRALMDTLGGFIPAEIEVKQNYKFTTANTAPLLRGLRAVSTFSSLKLLVSAVTIPIRSPRA